MQILFNGMWNIKWLSSLSIADIKEQFDTCFFSKNYWKLYLTGLENTLIITVRCGNRSVNCHSKDNLYQTV